MKQLSINHQKLQSNLLTILEQHKSSLWLFARVGISIFVLWFIFTKIAFNTFLSTLLQINIGFALAGFAVGIVTVYLSAWQWQVILRKERINLPFWLTTALYFIGITFNQLLPSSIGGDIVKATYVTRISKEGVQSTSATFMARFVGLSALLLTSLPVAAISLFFHIAKIGELFGILLLVTMAYAAIFVIIIKNDTVLKRIPAHLITRLPMSRKIIQLSQTFSSYQQQPRILLQAIGISALFYAASNLNFYLYGLALGISTPFWFYWIAVPLSALLTMLPISLNGYGVRGASFVGLFSIMGIAAARSLSLSTVMEIQMLLLAVLGAICIPAVNRYISPETQQPKMFTFSQAFSGGNAMSVYVRNAMTPTRALLGSFIILLLVAIPLSGQRLGKGTPKVTLYTVAQQTINEVVGGGGVIFPKQTLQVTYPVSAQILSVDVSVGQSVSAGQSLITLDVASLNAQLELAYQQMQIATNYYNNLVDAGALASQLANAESQIEIAQNKYNTLNGQIHSPSFNGGHIVSSFAGVVTEIDGVPGTLFRPGDTLVVLQDISSYIVHAEFPISEAPLISLGEIADVYPDNQGSSAQTSYGGSVTSINPQLASDGSNTFTVWITVPVQQQQIVFLGQSVFVQIHKTVSMLAVPKMSMLRDGANSYVFVYAGGIAHLQMVTTGDSDTSMVGITSGLLAGDKVIEAGQYQLTDNQKVLVSNPSR